VSGIEGVADSTITTLGNSSEVLSETAITQGELGNLPNVMSEQAFTIELPNSVAQVRAKNLSDLRQQLAAIWGQQFATVAATPSAQ